MVTAIAYSNFRQNLKTYMRKARQDADPILVTNTDPQDNIIVMNADDYDSLMETMRVYDNPYLRDKISRGLRQARAGHAAAHDIAETAEA